jgi:hypothetical protein
MSKVWIKTIFNFEGKKSFKLIIIIVRFEIYLDI